MALRVLVVDDNPLFAEAVASLLESDARIDVVGCARNGAEGVDFAAKLSPDVVLMDVRMPVMDGIEATGRIAARSPRAKVLVLTGHGSDEELECALGAGAVACLAKEELGLRLIDAVLACAGGSVQKVGASFSSVRLP